MKGAPAFDIDVVIDDKCVLRFRCVRAAETMFVADECAGGTTDGSILLGISETDVSVMHLSDKLSYPVSRDECIVSAHAITLPDDSGLLHKPYPLK